MKPVDNILNFIMIGVEHELPILDEMTGQHVNVKWQPQVLLPHDRCSLLAEVRTNRNPIGIDEGFNKRIADQYVDTLRLTTEQFKTKGLKLVQEEIPYRQHEITEAFEQNPLPYWHWLSDATQEVKHDDDPGYTIGKPNPDNIVWRGNGLHIHIGATINQIPWCTTTPHVLAWLKRNVWEIVKQLDKALVYDINGKSPYRKPSQWQYKPWGFEYRSLQMTSPLTLHNAINAIRDAIVQQNIDTPINTHTKELCPTCGANQKIKEEP